MRHVLSNVAQRRDADSLSQTVIQGTDLKDFTRAVVLDLADRLDRVVFGLGGVGALV